jgi:biopolymer transport protein ExbD
MSGSLKSDTNAEPNLTPILDMVFQLITFFMLVINFKSAAIDLSLKLPVVGSAQPVDTKGAKMLLVLNVKSNGQLSVYNREQPDPVAYIRREAETYVKLLQKQQPAATLGDELPTTIVLRADGHTPYGKLDAIVRACQDAGFRNFFFKALKSPPKA